MTDQPQPDALRAALVECHKYLTEEDWRKHMDEEELVSLVEDALAAAPVQATDALREALEGEHTPEPWACDPDSIGHIYAVGDKRATGACGNVLTYTGRPLEERRANARRIVACVNACAGMADPAADIARMLAALAAAPGAVGGAPSAEDLLPSERFMVQELADNWPGGPPMRGHLIDAVAAFRCTLVAGLDRMLAKHRAAPPAAAQDAPPAGGEVTDA